jgi:dual specificity tyrosine-phosphorylation-regulated kinase 2/3/4
VPSPPPPLPVHQPESPTSYAPPPRAVRARKSTEESAGEEILYPRSIVKTRHAPDSRTRASDASGQPLPTIVGHSRDYTSDSAPSVPPTVFSHTLKAKKRTSDEFAFDQGGAPISKTPGSSANPVIRKDERRRSIGLGSLSSKDRERIRERRQKDNVALSMGGLPKPGTAPLKDREPRERHVRRSSASASIASSSSKDGDSSHSRRAHDFSHLPASPSTTAVQPHVRANGPNGPNGSPPGSGHHSTASVAHSLLRGTQEGWSGMDDSATAEALRKLDGISGRSLRARSSLISVNSKSSSRPGTPGSQAKSGQWEGIEGTASLKRRSSLKDRDHTGADSGHNAHHPPGLPEGADNEWPASPGHRKGVPSTASARSSYGVSPAKRSSGGSTTGTPATSVSRDSTSISTSTSLTSASNASNRHSINNGKLRRSNSTGSDISSIHSNEKDRVAALAAGEHPDLAGVAIPPVPPLPKVFKTTPAPVQNFSVHEDPDRTIIVPTIEMSSPHKQPAATSTHQPVPIVPPAPAAAIAPAPRTPSKKWSFNLRLSSSSKEYSPGPMSPRSPRTDSSGAHNRASIALPATSKASASQKESSRFSSSFERLTSSPSSSLLHLRSPNSSPASTPQRLPSGSQQSLDKLSRPGTASSGGHQPLSSAATLAAPLPVPNSPSKKPSTHRRLTPTSIPFFKRASAHGMPAPTPPTTTLSPSSPTMPVVSNMPTTPLQSLTRLTPPDLASSPGSNTAKKTSVFGSFLKASTSKNRLHGDKSDKEGKEKSGDERKEKKKDEKDRSESRISVLMGRRRGKVCQRSRLVRL